MVAVGGTHLRLLAVTAAACMVVMTVSCSSAEHKSAAPGSSETPQKPEFTQVTSSMFVDRSAVPNSAAIKFTAPSIRSYTAGSSDPVDPPECAPLYWGPDSTQAGSVSWSTMRLGTSTNNEGKVFNLFLAVPAERPDFRSLFGKCGTIKYQGDTTTMSPLPLPGLPSWSTAYRLTVRRADGARGPDGAGIIGFCRGLLVSVVFTQLPGGDISPNDTNALVTLFNDQVAKLQAI